MHAITRDLGLLCLVCEPWANIPFTASNQGSSRGMRFVPCITSFIPKNPWCSVVCWWWRWCVFIYFIKVYIEHEVIYCTKLLVMNSKCSRKQLLTDTNLDGEFIDNVFTASDTVVVVACKDDHASTYTDLHHRRTWLLPHDFLPGRCSFFFFFYYWSRKIVIYIQFIEISRSFCSTYSICSFCRKFCLKKVVTQDC